jgi:hypothetical protein
MKTCVYFRKISHYDANFAAANFFLECKLRTSIHMNYENWNIRKLSLRIQKVKFAHTCHILVHFDLIIVSMPNFFTYLFMKLT